MSAGKGIAVDAIRDATTPLFTAMGRNADEITGIDPLPGRNITGRVELGRDVVFVKALRGLSADARFARSVSIFDVVDVDTATFCTPRLVASEAATLSTAYEYVEHAETDFSAALRAGELSGDELTQSLTRTAVAIAGLHSHPPKNVARADVSIPALPPYGANAISLEMFESSTVGELDLWRIIQGDEQLRGSLNDLVHQSARAAAVPTHGDLRSDQIFITEEDVWLLDWEEFRLSDAARDIGSLVGEIYSHRLRVSLNEVGESGDQVNDRAIIDTGTRVVSETVPSIKSFWDTYLQTRSDVEHIDVDFPTRCVQYAGWLLFDRALATAGYYGRMSAMDKAIAGIGREAILGGHSYVPVLGLGSVTP